jgi:hypothetical protein
VRRCAPRGVGSVPARGCTLCSLTSTGWESRHNVTISTELVSIALDKVEGSTFERFVNDFFPSISGSEFMPLGGVGDGGADAFGGDPVYEKGGAPTVFYQASVQEDFRGKIRHTVKRLRDFGREPRLLTYVTSRTVRHIDTEEDSLSAELAVTIRIRDGAYIASQVNSDSATRAAFDQHLRYLTDFLRSVGSTGLLSPSAHVKSPAVYVFLRQELDRRAGDQSLVDAVVDSLALWALEGTDPDKGLFMTVEEVRAKIQSEIPSAEALIRDRLERRLRALGAKDNRGGRAVRWHRKEDLYCLPFETRKVIEDENIEDETLRLHVLNSFYSRAAHNFSTVLLEDELRQIAHITLRALQLAFEKEGLEFSHFISQGQAVEYPTIGDSVRAALAEARVSGDHAVSMAAACLATVRGCLYGSTEQERLYLGKLSRTYALLFTLNTEPRLVQYFQDMAADFYLYVGSDLIIRAMSERYLSSADQLVKNTLLLAARAGSKMVLTEPVLEEVLTHLQATDREYHNYFEGIEHRVTYDMASNAPKILLRTYLYSRLKDDADGGGPFNWPNFIEQFISYKSLHKSEAMEQLRRYLQATFSMEYRTKDDLRQLVSAEKVDQIAELLGEQKRDHRLAENDALLACAVYGRRRRRREQAQVSEFGYQTWWLTNETAILRHTRPLASENSGARYMMRPDFLLNFLTFAPRLADVRRTFGRVFPSLLGIQLSKRMDEDAFHKIMEGVREAESMEEGRRLAAMAEYADRLKGDFAKRYRVQLEPDVDTQETALLATPARK